MDLLFYYSDRRIVIEHAPQNSIQSKFKMDRFADGSLNTNETCALSVDQEPRSRLR